MNMVEYVEYINRRVNIRMIQSATEMAKFGELRRGEYSIPSSSGITLNQRSSGS